MREKGYVQGHCPHCGAKIPSYQEKTWIYGSPLRTCRKCKNRYIDIRFHEIALEGVRPCDVSAGPPLSMALMGFIVAAISTGLLYYEFHYSDSYHIILLFLAPVGVGMIFCGIVDAIRAKLGLKAKKMEKLRKESVERLSDKNYAHELAARGFYIPEEYL
ncbi:MAG: hypothetical protein HDR00_10305 [Lachnospiraceae bacterium]|nr:hypothetical protein [Lachnospiraceae bacterium]